MRVLFVISTFKGAILRTPTRKHILAAILILTVLACPLIAQTPQSRVSYLSYSDAEPILSALDEVLPAELKGKSPSELSAAWPNWIAHRDAEIRARLVQGDEDSLVNFLLFGTSYTKRPRITAQELKQLDPANLAAGTSGSSSAMSLASLQARADDLIQALAAPGKNERLLFLRRLLIDQQRHNIRTAGGRTKLKSFLLSRVAGVLKEQASYASALAGARAPGDTTEEFAERSRIFRSRGLSSDTSLLPNFALEESLKAITARGLLSPGSVRRIAIVGPGLDFTDKQEGYDFYPQQTIQPFAIIDTLLRLGLARADALQVTTFDLSPG